MKLTKFRVFNYMSVRDSGYCWLASDLTILAGKNESGKTAILEALRDFDSSAAIPEAAHPIDRPGELPRLECLFSLQQKELEEIFKPYSDAHTKALLKRIAQDGLTLFKDHEGRYSFDEAISAILARIDEEETEKAAAAEAERVARLAEEAARRAAEEGAEEDDEPEAGVAEEEEEEEEEEGEEAAEDEGPKPLLETFVERLPRFILFSSFEDFLPFEITFTKAKTSPSIQD
ncbi:MAG: AAA family ATPase, partial [Vicinamibacteria bacterium]